jgi:3-oxoadipate enol-lactonase
MAFAELNGLRIYYEIIGDAALPALVFSNSLGVNLAMWEPQLRALASHFRILRYDTRGHGKSSVPTGPYHIAELGSDVLHLLDRLDIQRASFCGISMGGVIGQWLGINTPNRLDKLILANTAAKIGIEDVWNTRISTVLSDGLDTVIPGTLERWFTTDFRIAQPGILAATSAMLHATSVQGYVACCAAIRDADFRNSIRSISAPTLVITGTHDPVTTPGDGLFLAQNITQAKYRELPAAHLSNVESSAEFNAAALTFLKS